MYFLPEILRGCSTLATASASLTVRGTRGLPGRVAAALANMAFAAGGGRDAAGGDHEGDAYHDESPPGSLRGEPLPVQGEYHADSVLWASYDKDGKFEQAARSEKARCIVRGAFPGSTPHGALGDGDRGDAYHALSTDAYDDGLLSAGVGRADTDPLPQGMQSITIDGPFENLPAENQYLLFRALAFFSRKARHSPSHPTRALLRSGSPLNKSRRAW